MKTTACRYCDSTDLYLEAKEKDADLRTADIVAIKCGNCGKWLAWCPKGDRDLYLPKDYQCKVVLPTETKSTDIDPNSSPSDHCSDAITEQGKADLLEYLAEQRRLALEVFVTESRKALVIIDNIIKRVKKL